jgi:uncharacterized protein (TIGR00255 family)
MTGYGREDLDYSGRIIHIEIRTLNSKQADINLKTSPHYREKDLELRSLLSERLERGKIDLSIYVDNATDDGHITINKALAVKYFDELRELASEIGEDDFRGYLPLLTRMPEVFNTQKEELNPEEWDRIRQALGKVLDQVDQFRIQEGHILKSDLVQRIGHILGNLDQVSTFESNRLEAIRERLNRNLSEIAEGARIDTNRFEQELIYYLDKIDISEEKVRLKKHCDYFLETMDEPGAVGKKLAFITQEIGREMNTLGAKANEVNIQKLVVQMKDELEKIKEQLSNIL